MLRPVIFIQILWTGLLPLQAQAQSRILPHQPTVQPGGLIRFDAPDLARPLAWSVEAGGGWIAWNGEYKAPARPGFYPIRARDAKGQEAEGFVNVVYQPTLSLRGRPFQRGEPMYLAIEPFPKGAKATIRIGDAKELHAYAQGTELGLPVTPGPVEITAMVEAFGDAAKELRATVTVLPGPSRWARDGDGRMTHQEAPGNEAPVARATVEPTHGMVHPGDVLGFQVKGGRATSWFASAGTLDAKGRWTAPVTSGGYHIWAEGEEGLPKPEAAWLTVADVEIVAGPAEAICGPGKKVDFIALASRGPVCWEILDAKGGSIIGDGHYTAPELPGRYKVRARSLWNPEIFVDLAVEVEAEGQDMPGAFAKPDPAPVPRSEGLHLTPSILKLDAGTYQSFNLVGDEDRPAGALPLIATARCLTGSGDGKVEDKSVFTAATPGIYEIRFVDPERPERFATALAMVEPSIRVLKGIPRDLADRELMGIAPLATGESFLTGGRNKEKVPLATSYLMGGAEEGFRPSVPLRGARYDFRMAALKGGQVLVLGGHGTWTDESGKIRQGRVPFAELLDPAARAAVPLPRPAADAAPGQTPSQHLGGTLTALEDGTALACGGGPREGEIAGPSFVFDPVSARFIPVDGPAIGAGHAATLLRDGRVFLSGGFQPDGRPTDQTWIFDPKARQIRPAARMGVGRAFHGQSAFFDDKILVSGGVLEGDPSGEDGRGRPTASSETWTPGATRFVKAAPMKRPRAGHASVYLPTGQVMILGGWTRDGKGGPVSYPPELESYSPDSGLWTVHSINPYGLQRPVAFLTPYGSIYTSGTVKEPTAKSK